MNTTFTSDDWGPWHLASRAEMVTLYQSQTHPNSSRTEEICDAFTPVSYRGDYEWDSWRGIYNETPTSVYNIPPKHFWSGIFLQEPFISPYTDLNSGNIGSHQNDDYAREAHGGWIVATAYAPPTVPVPGAFLLFGSGLLGLVGYKRKRQ